MSGQEFLNQLAALCEKHQARFYYTCDDDGIHIDAAGETVFTGFMDGDAAALLRAAAEKQTEKQRSELK